MQTVINADWVQLNCRAKAVTVAHCKLEYESNGRGYVDGRGVVETFSVKKVYDSGIAFDTVFSETVQTKAIAWHKDYRVVQQDFRTSLAAAVYYVYFRDTKIAEVLGDVDSKVIDEFTIFVRFDNKFLYGEKLYDRVSKFLEDNGLEFHNWTRFDVACDFNYFNNGLAKYSRNKELNPADFMRKYLNREVRLFNKRRGKKRKGCIWFEDGENDMDLQTLKLGSPTSAVTVKLYNKSIEMREREDKPYIREQWNLNALEYYDVKTKKRVDTWRVEFAVTDFDSIVCDSDELKLTLKSLEILKDENTELLWNVLQEHYFVFVKPSKTDKNITRSGEIVNLFDKCTTGLKLRELSGKRNTTRSHKIFLKKLLETQQTIREYNHEMEKVNWATDFLAAWLINKHDLAEWSKTRFPGWKLEDYSTIPDVAIEVKQFSLTKDFDYRKEPHKFSY